MNIQQFQYVLAVVDTQNFEAAAEKCFITQSTLSTMIGRFEEEIGIRIFNRKTKPVSITPEGEQIIERLRIVTNEIDSMKNMIQELKGEMVGELKIGIIPTIAPNLLPLFLTEFASRFPRVKIIAREMTTPDIQRALKSRSIDVGVLATPLNDNALLELDLYTEPFVVYDHTDKLPSGRLRMEDLDYSKLCLLQEGHCLRTQVHQICEMSDRFSGSDVNYEFESGSLDSLLRITKTRKGVTIIPYLASIDLPKREKKRLVEFEAPVPVRTVGLITHKYFVKKKLLLELQKVIQEATAGLIPAPEESQVMLPV